MSGSTIEQAVNLFPYGSEFMSYDELLASVNERRIVGVTDLTGAAVVWISDDDGKLYRHGVCILQDGSLSIAHAEYF